MQSALERWHELISVRAQQMDAAYARLGRSSADFWDRRASGFHRSTRDTIASDPLFLRLRQQITPQTTVLDVGAGTGRFAVALAPIARHVTALEPNASMLKYLHQEADARGLTNLSYLQSTWQEAPADLAADLIICSHVLYPIFEVDTFLTKLHAATREACYIYMRAIHFDEVTAPLWQHFHGEPRHLSPGYIHALDVLYDLGLYADVEIVKVPQSMRFPSLDIATQEMSEQLILPGDEKTTSELHDLLASWLVPSNGDLVFPITEMPCAIIRLASGK